MNLSGIRFYLFCFQVKGYDRYDFLRRFAGYCPQGQMALLLFPTSCKAVYARRNKSKTCPDC